MFEHIKIWLFISDIAIMRFYDIVDSQYFSSDKYLTCRDKMYPSFNLIDVKKK